jgi:hypothetical protein
MKQLTGELFCNLQALREAHELFHELKLLCRTPQALQPLIRFISRLAPIKADRTFFERSIFSHDAFSAGKSNDKAGWSVPKLN